MNKTEEHDRRLDEHSQRIKNLEQANIEVKVELRNLCEALKTSNGIMRMFIVLIGTGLLGFFFCEMERFLR
ncbi:MAG: hemolysin XhlA family protein [Clostridium sp.]|uniref:hemolysin XhlA family protein n=1 Tax=Clostridium sp. TaxID=1506 RepID=UPI003EE661CB